MKNTSYIPLLCSVDDRLLSDTCEDEVFWFVLDEGDVDIELGLMKSCGVKKIT